MTGKTSTVTIHHDTCDPAKWTAKDILIFSDFVKSGSMQHAASLARLGVQLVLSEHHVPKGGQLEEIGWGEPKGTHEIWYWPKSATSKFKTGHPCFCSHFVLRCPAAESATIAPPMLPLFLVTQ